ncbi:unnamed protein product, partial [Nesidiocoris tenuis]
MKLTIVGSSDEIDDHQTIVISDVCQIIRRLSDHQTKLTIVGSSGEIDDCQIIRRLSDHQTKSTIVGSSDEIDNYLTNFEMRFSDKFMHIYTDYGDSSSCRAPLANARDRRSRFIDAIYQSGIRRSFRLSLQVNKHTKTSIQIRRWSTGRRSISMSDLLGLTISWARMSSGRRRSWRSSGRSRGRSPRRHQAYRSSHRLRHRPRTASSATTAAAAAAPRAARLRSRPRLGSARTCATSRRSPASTTPRACAASAAYSTTARRTRIGAGIRNKTIRFVPGGESYCTGKPGQKRLKIHLAGPRAGPGPGDFAPPAPPSGRPCFRQHFHILSGSDGLVHGQVRLGRGAIPGPSRHCTSFSVPPRLSSYFGLYFIFGKRIKMSEAPAPAATGRPMRYPYTLTAKLAQFPFKYHYNNVWLFKYWLFGIAVSLPLFVKIGRA